MSELVRQGSQYTDDVRRDCIVRYAITGNASVVSRDTGIPRKTVADWVKSDWGEALVAEVRQENQNQHIATYHELTRKALDKASKGIDKLGDDLSASDIKSLVVTGATATDKARLLMGLSTSNPGKAEGVDELKRRFMELADNHRRIEESVVATVDKSEEKRD